ncbi:Wzz/FepE/Etk N-terminal domain-containing protein [uncultured Desulfobulbus sp.]|uniref:Wzz/FepE/Etk N-terminal domain-containing protein n=1 Tax=uncultured Desulfobulbus sp. TaxID=239745 RepID=UPI0029C900A3|nr:Wzz/FepE/Etk N-terminal domain-containing protein [uncultured Desulfobulbus sp.]
MDTQQRQLIKKYVDLVVGKWWLVAGCVLVATTIGLFYYTILPKVYQSTALLSYEPQQINPTARMDPEQGRVRLREALATLQELVTSRTSLEKVITQFSLYEEDRTRLPIEDVILKMRKKDIDIKPAPQGDIFSVTYNGTDPEKVVKVTNALASLFIEENLKYREERATETSKYTENELAMSKKVLDVKEEVMRDYKLKNFNEMPEQRQSNLAQLQALIVQNQGIQDSIQELERTKVLAQEQIGMHQRMASMRMSSEVPTGGVATSRQPETDAERLVRLRGYLNGLLLKYTENHPEVLRTKQLIDQLEKKGGTGQVTPGRAAGSVPSRESLAASMEIQRLQIQLKEIDVNIKQLREEQTAIPAQIAKYQRWIEAAPVREAEWNALTRDYTELRRNYDQLVAQNLQAQSAENLERNQKGSKFKIVDSARLPVKPFSPNFLKILLVALAAGFALGVGPIFILDFIDTSFKDVGELEEYIGVPVICAIPFIEKEAEIRKENFKSRVSVAVVSVYGTILVAAIVIMWIKGMIIV